METLKLLEKVIGAALLMVALSGVGMASTAHACDTDAECIATCPNGGDAFGCYDPE